MGGLKIKYEILSQERKQRNITQETMADKLGVSLSAYRKYERGDRLPNAELIETMAKILDISFKDICPDIYRILTTIDNLTKFIEFKTPYKYEMWEKPIKTKNGIEYEEPDITLIYPDGTTKDISYSDFTDAEKSIQNFIDFTFKNLKGKEVK